ncbi:MAG: DNA-nicking Smr family endonuclease [Alphaproteobacteria bacterium]|jgi:DNA-nicking Smr family endonuclease
MSKKNDESLDFSALFKDAKPVSHNQYVLTKDERERKHIKESSLKLAKKKASSNIDYAQNAASIELSDTFEAHWPDDKALKYFRASDISHKQEPTNQTLSYSPKDMLKKLSMGYFPPEIEIDLHGQTGKQAKAELLAVIFEAKKRHFACIGIIHGHGNGTLKRKVPNWLVQHPDVAGFIQAPREYGGKAGLLVLIGIDFQAYKPE